MNAPAGFRLWFVGDHQVPPLRKPLEAIAAERLACSPAPEGERVVYGRHPAMLQRLAVCGHPIVAEVHRPRVCTAEGEAEFAP